MEIRQTTRKAGMMVIATALASMGATWLMAAETEFELVRAGIALGFAGAVFAAREWSKKFDSLPEVVKIEQKKEGE